MKKAEPSTKDDILHLDKKIDDSVEDLAVMIQETMVTKDEFYEFQKRAFETFATKEDLKAFVTKEEFHTTMDYVITAMDSIAKDVKDIKGEMVMMNANHQRLAAIVELYHPA